MGVQQPEALQVLSALIGDMSCGLLVGGNDDENLRDYLDRLISVAVDLDRLFEALQAKAGA